MYDDFQQYGYSHNKFTYRIWHFPNKPIKAFIFMAQTELLTLYLWAGPYQCIHTASLKSSKFSLAEESSENVGMGSLNDTTQAIEMHDFP